MRFHTRKSMISVEIVLSSVTYPKKIGKDIRNMKHLLTTATIIAFLGTGAAFADDCSDEDVADRREIVIAFLDENPEKEPEFSALAASVEAEYGGEPPREKLCEAMDKVIAGLKAMYGIE